MISAQPQSHGPQAPLKIYATEGRQHQHPEPRDEPAKTGRPEADEAAYPQDRVSLSAQGLSARAYDARTTSPLGGERPRDPQPGATTDAPAGSHQADGEADLDSQDAERIRELKQRDAEVKAHEQAHMAAGGGLVQGAASYTYEKGPDGGMYAVGGEVKIDTAPAQTPEQTIRKAQQIRRAALAPAEPSGTDRAVAAAASQMEAQARAEKTRDSAEEEGADAPAAADASQPIAAAPTPETAANPFTAPALQAYGAAADATVAARTVSTFA